MQQSIISLSAELCEKSAKKILPYVAYCIFFFNFHTIRERDADAIYRFFAHAMRSK